MTDELYFCPVFGGDVVPLLRSNYDFHADSFYSAAMAVAGELHSRAGWCTTRCAGSSDEARDWAVSR